MSQVLDRARNGVDTEQMYGTLDAIKAAAGARRVPVPRPEPLDRRRAQPLDDPGLLRRRAGGHLARRGVRARCRRARGPARHRHRPQPGRGAAARARGVPDDVARLRRGRAQGPPDRGRVDARGRHGRPRRARALRRGAQRLHAHPRDLQGQGRRARRRSCARSSSAPRRARPSSTWSATACRSRWPSSRAERAGGRARARPPALTGDHHVSSSPPRPRRRRLVRLAESLADDLATRAAEHDRDARYPLESIDALERAGYFAAPIPVEHGGPRRRRRCTTSSSPSSRLARGDASVAIGVNMHLVVLLNIVRRWQIAVAAGNERRAAALRRRRCARIARDGVVIAAAISEHGQDLTRPATTATRTGAGWRVDGRKVFCTMSPAATVLYTAVTFADDDGGRALRLRPDPDRRARASTIHGDWDALGMRASGSHSVTLRRRRAPARRAARRLPGRRRRRLHGAQPRAPGLFHASASLGIAESAARGVARALAARGEPDARARMLARRERDRPRRRRATLAAPRR